MSETKATQIQPVKQVTHKTGGFDPRDLKKNSQAMFMTRLSGVLESVRVFEDRTGTEKTVFTGDFIAQGADGNTYGSDKMFLFKSLEEKLAGAWTAGEKKAVEFSYDVVALYDEKSATRYVYQARAVTATATNDRMHSLMSKVNAVPMLKTVKEAVEVPAGSSPAPAPPAKGIKEK